jgi:O-succinylhomoserine sulfhydrylase
MLFMETPSNPLTEVGDIRALADLAHANGAKLVVDNCFCTPVLQRPLLLGADIVVHSATKYLDGQGRCVGGAVVGDMNTVGEEVFGVLRTAGPTLSPFNAWVFLKGLETLSVRMLAQSDQAQQLSEWLVDQPGVTRVYYPGLRSHPQYELAAAQTGRHRRIRSGRWACGGLAGYRFDPNAVYHCKSRRCKDDDYAPDDDHARSVERRAARRRGN